MMSVSTGNDLSPEPTIEQLPPEPPAAAAPMGENGGRYWRVPTTRCKVEVNGHPCGRVLEMDELVLRRHLQQVHGVQS